MARTAGSHSEITGPKVRQAALELFARDGYAAVSMRQIAAAVGVQAGALYSYTPDKQTLLFDLLQSHMHELLEAWDAAPKTKGPAAQLEQFVRFHIAFHLARPETVFLSYMELRNLTPENFAVIEGLRKRYEGMLEQIISQGTQTGAFGIGDPKIASFAIIGMLKELGTWYRPKGRLSIEQITSLYWQMIKGAVDARQ